MVAPSKIYQYPLNEVHCSQILHNGKTCTEFFLTNLYRCFISSSKYFAPLLMSIVLKARTNDFRALYGQLQNYLQTVGVATLFSSTIFYFVCLLRTCNGRFTKYSSLFIPTYMGCSVCILAPSRVLRLYSVATSQAAIEAILRQNSNVFSRLLLNSKLVQTLLFMVNSAVILHLKQLKQHVGFWFIQPINPIKTENETDPTVNRTAKCMHLDKSCTRFIWNGIRAYLPYGVLIDLLNALLKGKLPKNPMEVIMKFKATRWSMTGFFVFYAGVYRLATCLVAKYFSNSDANLQHLIGAFLGGAAYLFLGKVTFFTLSLVIAIQIAWQHFCSMEATTNKTQDSTKQNSTQLKVLKLLRALPFGMIVVPLNIAYLVHCFVYHHHVVNSLGRGFINATTDNITHRFYNLLISSNLEQLLTETSKKVAMKFI